MEILERFTSAVSADDAGLDELVALVAAHLDPGVDPDVLLQRLDDLAAEIRVPTLDGLLRWFRDAGFAGNVLDYTDPANSLLHEVLDRRIGIPITLSVVLLEVGRRVGVPLAPVSLPGHFLVRDKVDPSVYVDAFDSGRIIDVDGVRAIFAGATGGRSPFDPTWLEPAPKLAVTIRVLNNLKMVAGRRQDLDLLARTLELRLAIPEIDRRERAELAAVLVRRLRFDEAADQLERLADEVAGVDAERHRVAARGLRARLN